MKDLVKVWLAVKVAGEVLTLVGITICVGTVAWMTFVELPRVIGEVFGF